MKPHLPHNRVTDAQLDAALRSEHDQILPSSGFADGVMTAVQAEAAAPAPIPFPWKRAIPGMAVGLALLAALISALVSVLLRSSQASTAVRSGVPANWKQDLTPLLHTLATPNAAWISLALAIPLVCLIALRRLIFSR
jgi:hypothetical protein